MKIENRDDDNRDRKDGKEVYNRADESKIK